jgi:putative ABC transport system permease protein
MAAMIWLQQVWHDLRFALRMLRRAPSFAVTTILTLAIGIGLTSTVFSVFNAVLLKPLSYPNPERLVWIATRDPDGPFPLEAVVSPDFLDWQEHAQSFEHIVSYAPGDEPFSLDGHATRERIAGVSDGFWPISGVRLAHGRLPAANEPGTLLVSYEFFENRLAGDVQRIGQTALVDGDPVTIIGVLPRNFPMQLPSTSSPGFEPMEVVAYRTARIEPPSGNQMQLLSVIGKLKAGVSLDTARAELETLRARNAQKNPDFPGNRMRLRLVPLSEQLTGNVRLALSVLLAAVAFVLLIACANVASLLFGRGAARQKEIAIRAAVGADRGRLFRQLLIESALLAAAGGTAGLVLAQWSLALIIGLMPHAMPRLAESTIDGSVLAFTAVAALVTALAFGVGPALALGTGDLQRALTLGAKQSSSVSIRPRAGTLLVAAEMALALVLLTGAGLLVKSFWLMNARPAGFDPGRVLTMTVQFSGLGYAEDPPRQAYIREFLERTRAVAGVSAAGISSHGETRTVAFVEGRPPLPPEEMMQRQSVLMNAVSEGTAGALGMRVLRGRWISDAEPSQVVVNESMVRRIFPSEDPLGRRIRLGGPDGPLDTIVGIVADLRYAALDDQPEPEVYVPFARSAPWRFTAIVSTLVRPTILASTIMQSVADIDRTQPVYDVRTLEQALTDSVAPQRLNLYLLAIFAGAALALALMGVYSVIAHSVTQRTYEIGVRLALGADRRRVVGMIVRQGFRMATAGIIVGVAAAAMLTRVMTSLLFDVEATDPETFIAAAGGLLITALVASLVPALRAARIDPAETLR